jgi:hypothetical protein
MGVRRLREMVGGEECGFERRDTIINILLTIPSDSEYAYQSHLYTQCYVRIAFEKQID